MKSNSLKIYAIAASIAVGTGHSAISAAHEQIDSLGEALGSTDLYVIICGSGTERLTTSISAGSGAGQVNSLIFYFGTLTSTSDPVSGDNQPGPSVSLSGSDQRWFYVPVTKTAAGPQSYRLTYHCETSRGGHTDTSILQRQNQ